MLLNDKIAFVKGVVAPAVVWYGPRNITIFDDFREHSDGLEFTIRGFLYDGDKSGDTHFHPSDYNDWQHFTHARTECEKLGLLPGDWEFGIRMIDFGSALGCLRAVENLHQKVLEFQTIGLPVEILDKQESSIRCVPLAYAKHQLVAQIHDIVARVELIERNQFYAYIHLEEQVKDASLLAFNLLGRENPVYLQLDGLTRKSCGPIEASKFGYVRQSLLKSLHMLRQEVILKNPSRESQMTSKDPVTECAEKIVILIGESEKSDWSGDELIQHIGASTRDINDAVSMLKEYDIISIRQRLGTAPFQFASVESTGKTRQARFRLQNGGELLERYRLPIMQTIVHGDQLGPGANKFSSQGEMSNVNVNSPRSIVQGNYGELIPRTAENLIDVLRDIFVTIIDVLESNHDEEVEHLLGNQDLLIAVIRRLNNLENAITDYVVAENGGREELIMMMSDLWEAHQKDALKPRLQKIAEKNAPAIIRSIIMKTLTSD